MVWTLFIIHREYQHLIKIRQEWLASSTHASLPRVRTVMLVNLPQDLMSESALRELAYGITHSSSRIKVWLSRDAKKIEEVYDERTKEHARLEAGERKMLMQAVKNVKKGKTPGGGSSSSAPKITWKQGLLGLWGRKMDREQSPAFIREKNEELERMRSDMSSFPLGNVAFLRFRNQQEAHTFARVVNK
ncbi:hypothetical protein QFC22_006762 [Naganishia vaughanmartiniae]|uniref:Uncharacterized protein n=1 Tax=Naganishia vaughanmartiniae TaxID=1424756 RepID=A0ACC2WEN1_9TREE|nr:hypothetical protein QFC22_006762 [Naganishia vaughanmartiniae]